MHVRAGVVPSATMQTQEGRWVIIGGNGDSVYTRLMAAGAAAAQLPWCGCVLSPACAGMMA